MIPARMASVLESATFWMVMGALLVFVIGAFTRERVLSRRAHNQAMNRIKHLGDKIQ